MTKPNYAGTTLNERLFAKGVLNEFDAAIGDKDRVKLIELLKAVEVDNPYGIANSLIGLGYQCWFCGGGIEPDGREALAICLSDLWAEQSDEPPTQMIYAHFDCAEMRMRGSSMALERDMLFASASET
ncbi:hypothetical protein [Sphingobium sp.]|uniref:hypothetical protein n=1 Tax=Sphingobium sp. TaxID=1912891 RepID=UPI00262C1B5F|nr:hypothetical protein [Sphingobium sp.]